MTDTGRAGKDQGERGLLLVLVLTALAHTLWVAGDPATTATHKTVGNLFFFFPYLLAARLSLSTARIQAQPLYFRRAWTLITAGLACWATGQALFTYLHLSGARTFPSFADLGFVLLPLLFMLGILQFFRAPISRLQRLTFALDVGMLVVTFANLLWTDYVTASWKMYADQPFALLMATAYPTTDILMIALMLAMALWSPRETLRGYNALLGLGLLLFLWGSVGYGVLVSRGTYAVGGPLDVTWSWAAVLFGCAAIDAARAGGRPLMLPRVQAALTETTALLLPLLPYVAVVASFLLALTRRDQGGPPYSNVQALIVAALALLRFFLTELHNRRLTRQLDRQARYDELTGTLNRRVLRTELPRLTRDALARGEGLAVIFLDLDRFKQINDTFGHEVGDAVLARTAARLRATLHPSDVLIRMGGDEFVLILADRGELQDVRQTAEEVLRALGQPFPVVDPPVTVAASLGIACLPTDTRDLEEAVRFADLAMYQAKQQGRNTYRFHNLEWHTQASEQFDLTQELRRALTRAEFSLHYQPVVQAESGRLRGFEALIRWTSRKYGPVPPVKFIRLAEEEGLIVEIGGWVLNEALRQLRVWHRQEGPGLTVAVNISAVQFRQPDFVQTVLSALKKHDLPGKALTLELTESSLLEDVQASRTILAQLRTHGIGLALDDFGTGYSSLAYLRDLPVTVLKIDRSFVWSLDQVGVAIVQSIVSLAHQLQLRVVAEGIETPEQLRQVAGLGCDDVQGYLLARPLPPAEAVTFMQQRP